MRVIWNIAGDQGVGFAHSIYICVHTNIYYITEYTRYSKINLLNVARSNVPDVPEACVDERKEESSEVKTIFFSSSMSRSFEHEHR